MQLNRRELLKTGAILAVPTLLGGKPRFLSPSKAPGVVKPPPRFDINDRLHIERMKRKKQLEQNWELQDFSPSYPYRWEIAALLENQDIYNNGLPPNRAKDEVTQYSPKLIRRMFKNSVLHEMFGFQTLEKRAELTFWRDAKREQTIAIPIVAERFKWRTTWNWEVIYDLKSVHGLDASEELLTLVADEIQVEMTRRVVTQVKLASEPVEKRGDLATAINFELNRIHNKTQDKTANNWVFTSPENVAKLMWDISAINDQPDPITLDQLGCGVMKIGRFKCDDVIFDLFQDALFPTNETLIGCKGWRTFPGDELPEIPIASCGVVVCPFIGIEVSPVFLDPGSFTPQKNFYTYYGTKLLNHDYYTLIKG